MAKMVAMPIYSKTLGKSSAEPKNKEPWNLVSSIYYDSRPTKFVQMMALS